MLRGSCKRAPSTTFSFSSSQYVMSCYVASLFLFLSFFSILLILRLAFTHTYHLFFFLFSLRNSSYIASLFLLLLFFYIFNPQTVFHSHECPPFSVPLIPHSAILTYILVFLCFLSLTLAFTHINVLTFIFYFSIFFYSFNCLSCFFQTSFTIILT